MNHSISPPDFANSPFAFAPAALSDKDLLRRVSERFAAKVAKMTTAERISMKVKATALLHPAAAAAAGAALAAECLRKAKARAAAAAPAPAAPLDPRAALLAQLEATKDNAERYRIAERINNLPVPGAF